MIVLHRRSLGRQAQVRWSIGIPVCRACHQIEEIALTTGAIPGTGIRPVEQQIEIGDQLGTVGLWLKGIHRTAMNQ